MEGTTRKLLERLEASGGALTLGDLSSIGFTNADLESAKLQNVINTNKIFIWRPNTRIWLTPLGQELLGQERSREVVQDEVKAVNALHDSVKKMQESEVKAIGELQKSMELMSEAEVKAIDTLNGSVKLMNDSVGSVKLSVIQLADTTERLAKRNERFALYLLGISAAILAVSLLNTLLHFY